MFQRNKIKPHEELSELEISNLPDKEFKVMIVNMLKELWRRIMNSENFNKELGNIRKNQTELKNTIMEIKMNTLEGINSSLIQRNGLSSWKT